mmetsp:Transcript_125794/g.317101  ORF Transcript_125794/g.317101 Transcript_125794/m.317101 type:complete len:240 (+) Transcript_125794:1153-1872(+)
MNFGEGMSKQGQSACSKLPPRHFPPHSLSKASELPSSSQSSGSSKVTVRGGSAGNLLFMTSASKEHSGGTTGGTDLRPLCAGASPPPAGGCPVAAATAGTTASLLPSPRGPPCPAVTAALGSGGDSGDSDGRNFRGVSGEDLAAARVNFGAFAPVFGLRFVGLPVATADAIEAGWLGPALAVAPAATVAGFGEAWPSSHKAPAAPLAAPLAAEGEATGSGGARGGFGRSSVGAWGRSSP